LRAFPCIAAGMSPTNISSEHQDAATLCVAAGLICYTASFFLPAVELEGGSLKGFECAKFALLVGLNPNLAALPMLAAGAVNLLAVLSLALRLSNRPGLRRAVAMAAIVLVPFSWLAITVFHATILIGHVVWVSGLLLFLGPEVLQYARGGRQ
jgi:hypothetical protein